MKNKLRDYLMQGVGILGVSGILLGAAYGLQKTIDNKNKSKIEQGKLDNLTFLSWDEYREKIHDTHEARLLDIDDDGDKDLIMIDKDNNFRIYINEIGKYGEQK